MLEDTRIQGDPPDVALVYDLRRLAATGAGLAELLNLMEERQARGGFATAVYLSLSFGVRIPLLKELGAALSEDLTNAEVATSDVAGRIMHKINENKDAWLSRLDPHEEPQTGGDDADATKGFLHLW